MISAKDPFFKIFSVVVVASVGGGVGCPCLKFDDDVENWVVGFRLLGPEALSFIRSIDVFTPPGLLFGVGVREVSVGLEEPMVVL
jgi:hypothetical protein